MHNSADKPVSLHQPVLLPYSLHLGGGRVSPAVDIESPDELAAAVRDLRLAVPTPALVLVGGADGLAEAAARWLRGLFGDCVAPLVDRRGGALIDGGTDAGVMALIGQARLAIGGAFPLVGVVARGTVARVDDVASAGQMGAALEPNHTHFLMVPGESWGDESPWISRAAEVLSAGSASATLVAGGGAVTRRDIEHSLRAGRPTWLLKHSGGTADALADALSAGDLPKLDVSQARLALLRVIERGDAGSTLPELLCSLFAA
jgi:hypothetical protein